MKNICCQSFLGLKPPERNSCLLFSDRRHLRKSDIELKTLKSVIYFLVSSQQKKKTRVMKNMEILRISGAMVGEDDHVL